MLGVIEAMVAAPILMLGLAHPGGHDMLGHALPGVKMALAVIFRPVLMVIGLLVGIALTYVVISFTATSFHYVASNILAAVPDGVDFSNVKGVLAVLLLLVYSGFLVLAFNECFQTIYAIPEKVMQWIGGQADRAGAQQLQQVSSGLSSSAQGAGSAGGQAVGKGIEAGQSTTQGFGSAASSGAKGFGAEAGSMKESVSKHNQASDDSTSLEI